MERAYPYALTGPTAALDILTFLATELQASRIMASKGASTSKPAGEGLEAQKTLTATRMLVKALKSLLVDLPSGAAHDPESLVTTLEGAVNKRLAELPNDYLSKDEHLVKGASDK